MSRVSSIADVKEMDDKFPIPAFKGKVTAQYPRKEGETDGKPWSFENIIVTDRAGEKIKVVFSGRDPLPKHIKGKEVHLVCYSGSKGPSGVYAHDNEYRDEITREIKVTPTGEVTFGGALMHGRPEGDADGDTDEGEEEYKPQKKAKRRPGASDETDDGSGSQEREEQSRQSPPKGSTQYNALANARVFVTRRMRGYQICLDAAVVIGKEFAMRHSDIVQLTPEHFQAMCATLFIAADRAGQFDALPVTELPPLRTNKKEVVKETPKPPADDEVPF